MTFEAVIATLNFIDKNLSMVHPCPRDENGQILVGRGSSRAVGSSSIEKKG